MKLSFSHISPLPELGVFVCTTTKDIKKISKRYGIDIEILGASGQTSFVESKNDFFVVIYIDRGLSNKKDIAELIAHESYHAVRFYFNHLGEKKPSNEAMAYSVGSVARCVTSEYWRKRKK